MKVNVEEIASRPRALEIAAVRLGQIYEIPSSLILQPGPAALTEGVGRMHALLAQVARRGA
jgi:iron complex transport system substrate-binding protein